jgi:pyruvate/2-oxoglutarate dehydrogenase complex dihydrolipoamide acyltransferase (E2) component
LSKKGAKPPKKDANLSESAPLKPSAAGSQQTIEINGARFSDKAFALLMAHNLDPALFIGKGLIRERDVRKALGKGAPSEQTNVVAKGVSYKRVALSKIKQAEVNNLTLGDQNRLASLVSLPCPMQRMMESIRKRAGPGGVLAAVVCEAAKLLRRYPAFNGFYADGFAHYYEIVNVGFVIDGDRGLRVPIIKDADKKSVESVSREMQDLMLAYHEDNLPVESLSGGTFTVTDLSAEGIGYFHPLINHKQSAILGLGAEDGRDENFAVMLTFDHRMSEGRAAARFLKDLRDRLQAYGPE